MSKRQFTIRTLLIATALVCAVLPFAISHYDSVANFLFPHRSPATEDFVLDGIALRLGTNGKLVAISLGSDDGLRKGQAVSFTRNGAQVGTGTVTLTAENQSACRITRGNIMQGDYVTITNE